MMKKRFMLGLMVVPILTGISSDMNVFGANAVATIMSMYGASTEIIDVTLYQKELEEKKDNYREMQTGYYQDKYLLDTKDVSDSMEYDNKDYYLQIETDMKYLDSLVGVNADLDLIFEAETSYRNALRDFTLYQGSREGFNTSTYDVTGVTANDINSLVDSMLSIEEIIANAAVLPDIGDANDLRTPTVGCFNITSPFGYRSDPFTGVTAYHNRLDLAAPEGTDVITLFSGMVIKAGDFNDGYGYSVLVSHTNEFQTFYPHMSKISVKVGDYLEQYDKVGEVGSTGRSTGPHLHLGVYINNKAVDPLLLFSKG